MLEGEGYGLNELDFGCPSTCRGMRTHLTCRVRGSRLVFGFRWGVRVW